MLDNGYLYLAATRLSLYASAGDWAMVFEIFGYSPRAGHPDLMITTFTSRPVRTRTATDFVSGDAYREYLRLNANVEQSCFFPIEDDTWIDPEVGERVAEYSTSLILRGDRIPLPTPADYDDAGVLLEEPPRPLVSELARALAFRHRAAVLATEEERRTNLVPELQPLVVLEDWHHPDVVDSEALPSRTETFRQLAAVLSSGDPAHYHSTEPPNTHWSNWPDGGTL